MHVATESIGPMRSCRARHLHRELEPRLAGTVLWSKFTGTERLSGGCRASGAHGDRIGDDVARRGGVRHIGQGHPLGGIRARGAHPPSDDCNGSGGCTHARAAPTTYP
jgi:hypothetical protein